MLSENRRTGPRQPSCPSDHTSLLRRLIERRATRVSLRRARIMRRRRRGGGTLQAPTSDRREQRAVTPVHLEPQRERRVARSAAVRLPSQSSFQRRSLAPILTQDDLFLRRSKHISTAAQTCRLATSIFVSHSGVCEINGCFYDGNEAARIPPQAADGMVCSRSDGASHSRARLAETRHYLRGPGWVDAPPRTLRTSG